MPEGSKVGDVYLEATIDYDDRRGIALMKTLRQRFDKDMSAISEESAKKLGIGLAKGIGDGLDEGVSRNRNRGINAGRALGQLLAMGASAGIRDNARLLRDAMVIGMAGALGAITVGISGAIQAAFAITPAALGALPGLLLGVAGAVGVLKLSLSGVSDAIGKAFSEPFDEAGWKSFEKSLEGLSYHAASFARAVRAAAPDIIQFRKAVQDGFFGGNSNEATAAFAKGLKQLQPALVGVADKFGDIARALVFWASSAPAIENFKAIFAGIDAFLDTIRPALINVLDAFLDLGAQGASFAETLGEKVSKVLNNIAEWARNTSLEDVFNRAKPALEDIRRILDAIWGTLQTLFGGTGASSGGGPLELLADIAEALERGAGHIKNFIDMVANLPEPVKRVLEAVAVLGLLSMPLSSLVSSLASVAQGFMGLVTLLGALGIAALPAAAIITGVSLAILLVAGVLVTAWLRSEEFRDKVRAAFEEVKKSWEGTLKPALEELGEAIYNLVFSAERLLAEFGLDWGDLGSIVFLVIGQMIAMLDGFINALTFAVTTLDILLSTAAGIVNTFKDTWNLAFFAMQLAMDGFVGWITGTLLPTIGSIYDKVADTMVKMVSAMGAGFRTAQEMVQGAIKAIIGFVNDPLIRGFNIVAKAVGISEIPPIPIPFASGGTVPGSNLNPRAQLDASQVEDLRGVGTGGSTGSGGARGILRFAHGGIAPGYGNRDTVPALLTPGEGILTKDEMARIGGPVGFNQLRGIIQTFASGGIVQTLTEAFSGGASALGSVAGFSSEQMGNAAEIIRVGRSMGFPTTGLLVALITAMQESNLRNLGHLGAANDHDSVGLFQQRPSQGWGSVSELTTPSIAASKFFSALSRVPGWQGMAPTAAAQAVQKSAFPSAYAKWLGPAAKILGGGLGGTLDFFLDPVGKFVSGMLGELPNIGDHPFAQLLKGMGKQLVEGSAKKLFEGNLFSLFGGGVVTGKLGSAGMGVNAIINLVKGLAGMLGARANVTSAFRPGDPGHHGSGRAVDFGGYNQDALASALYKMGGSLLELIHTTDTRGYYIKNGRPISSYGSENEKHRDHIHVAMDQGGALGPGRTIVDNFTGKPEAVLNPQHSALVGRVLAGDGIQIDNHLLIEIDGSFVEARILSSEKRIAEAIRRGEGRR